jgi:hypothetical protein
MSKAEYDRWYDSRRWRKRRRFQLMQQPFCVYCQAEGRAVAATHVDHIERHGGDPMKFWTGAVQSLCATHHNRTKQIEERLGYVPGCDELGFPTDSRHPANRP